MEYPPVENAFRAKFEGVHLEREGIRFVCKDSAGMWLTAAMTLHQLAAMLHRDGVTMWADIGPVVEHCHLSPMEMRDLDTEICKLRGSAG